MSLKRRVSNSYYSEIFNLQSAVKPLSDITYVKTDQGHSYLALLTDAYSRKIMGWCLEDNMKVEMVKRALDMAHKNCIFNHKSIIHHSDRGIQYCCPDYSQFAEKKGFVLSTTQQYDPYENAIAERINVF